MNCNDLYNKISGYADVLPYLSTKRQEEIAQETYTHKTYSVLTTNPTDISESELCNELWEDILPVLLGCPEPRVIIWRRLPEYTEGSTIIDLEGDWSSYSNIEHVGLVSFRISIGPDTYTKYAEYEKAEAENSKRII